MPKGKYRLRPPKLENVHSSVPKMMMHGDKRFDYVEGIGFKTAKLAMPVESCIKVMSGVELRQVSQNHESYVIAFISPTSCDKHGKRLSGPRHIKTVTTGLDKLCGIGNWHWLPQVSAIQCVKLNAIPLLRIKPNWLHLEEHDARATAGGSSSPHLRPQARQDTESAKYMSESGLVFNHVNTGSRPSRTTRTDNSNSINALDRIEQGNSDPCDVFRPLRNGPRTSQVAFRQGLVTEVEES